MKPLILFLFLCGSLSAQYKPAPSLAEMCKKPRVEAWSYTPVENYVAGAMLIGTFFTVDYADRYLYDIYGRGIQRTQQRNIVAASCMLTTAVTFVVVREIRKHKKQRR